MPFPRPLGMSTKKAPPAGAPFVLPQLDGTGQEQCKSEPFVKNKGRVSSWRWYPAFGAISACSFMGECGILGLVQQIGTCSASLHKREFVEESNLLVLNKIRAVANGML